MTSIADTALSGDVEGFAPSHPADPSNVDAAPIKAPKGKIPAPTAAPENTSTAPVSLPEMVDRSPASTDDSDNPFIDKTPLTSETQATPPIAAGEEVNPFEDQPVPPVSSDNKSDMKNVIDTNLAAHAAMNPPQTKLIPEDPIHDFVHGLQAGLQISTAGLGIRGKMPDTILPEQADMAMQIGNQIGTLAGDLPAMVAGGIGGAAVGSVPAPVVGTIGLGTAGAFAVPAAIRKMYIDHYTKGDIADSDNPAREFASRLMATSWEAIKGATTGAATELSGGLAAPVAGKLAGMGAELVAMTTVGSALEGHLPKFQDFLDGAIVLGGLHAAGHVIPGMKEAPTDDKLRNIYAATGETPAQIIEKAKNDVELKQDLLAGNMQEPPQAAPAELVHEHLTEPGAEGEPEKIIGTKTELIPKTDAEMGLLNEAPTPVKSDLSNLADESYARQEILSKIGEPREVPGKTAKQVFSDFYAKNVDYLDPINSAIEEAKRNGAEIPEDQNAYNLGRLAAAHMDKTRGFLEYGTRDAETGKINGEGLNDVLKDVPDMDGFKAYALAKRALELNGRDITPWENFDKAGAQSVVDAGKKTYEDVNQRRIDFGNRVLDWAQGKGLFSESQASAMKEANKSYIPFNRAFEADEFTGTVKSGSALKEIFGSERDIVDPILQTYKNVEMIVKRATVNEVRDTFVKNLDEGGLLGTGEKNEELGDKFLTPVKQVGVLKDNQIAIFRDGERTVYEGTPGVVDSLKRLDGDSTAMDLTAKILRGFSNMVRLGVVSNPAFGFAHFFRSQIMSSVYSKTGMIPFIHSALSLSDFMGESDVYKQWLHDGGASGSLFKLNETYLKDNQVYEADKSAPFIGKAWNAVLAAKDASESFIKLTDNLSRFTEYKRSIEAGVNPIEAAMRSRDVVPDYAKVGLQRSVLRTGVAFIGAHINSLDRMFQEIDTDPKGFAMKMSVITAMSAALWTVNKDDEAIEALPDWQKNTYWNINISRFSPGYKGQQDATILRLPKPWAPGILFGSGAEVALDAYNKDNPREIHHFAQSVAKSVLPELVPNIVQPVLDQYSNKQAFTGRPLVPEYKQKLLPEMQYSPYTSETAKAIGKLIGYVPLVRDLGPSTDPLASPDVVENYIKTWGGTLGGWALKTSDWAGRGGKWDSGKADPWENTPFLHQFVSRFPNFQDQRIQDFYENRDEANKAFNSARAAANSGDFEAAERIRDAHPDFQVRLDSIAKGISTARKTYQNIQDDPNIPSVQKRQNLDAVLFQIGSMAKTGNQMMSDFRKNQVQNIGKGQGE